MGVVATSLVETIHFPLESLKISENSEIEKGKDEEVLKRLVKP